MWDFLTQGSEELKFLLPFQNGRTWKVWKDHPLLHRQQTGKNGPNKHLQMNEKNNRKHTNHPHHSLSTFTGLYSPKMLMFKVFEPGNLGRHSKSWGETLPGIYISMEVELFNTSSWGVIKSKLLDVYFSLVQTRLLLPKFLIQARNSLSIFRICLSSQRVYNHMELAHHSKSKT